MYFTDAESSIWLLAIQVCVHKKSYNSIKQKNVLSIEYVSKMFEAIESDIRTWT